MKENNSVTCVTQMVDESLKKYDGFEEGNGGTPYLSKKYGLGSNTQLRK